MEDPVREIPTVIRLLTQSPPTLQASTVEKFFTPNASFTHPFCRTWSFNGSRWLVLAIYRFYKIMSPRIELKVKSVAFDQEHLKLYVTISQLFSIFIVPFYLAPVTLTTVLTLTTNPNEYRGYLDFSDDHQSDDTEKKTETTTEQTRKYWISSQEDLYQTTEFIKFFLPFGIGVFLVGVWHLFSTAGCVAGTLLLSPVTWAEEKLALNKETREVSGRNVTDVASNVVERVARETGGFVNGVAESVQGRLKEM